MSHPRDPDFRTDGRTLTCLGGGRTALSAPLRRCPGARLRRAIVRRGYAELALERLPQGLSRSEAAARGDRLDRQIRTGEQVRRRLDSDATDVATWGQLEVPQEEARQLTLTDAGSSSKRRGAEVVCEVRGDVGSRVVHDRAAGRGPAER